MYTYPSVFMEYVKQQAFAHAITDALHSLLRPPISVHISDLAKIAAI